MNFMICYLLPLSLLATASVLPRSNDSPFPSKKCTPAQLDAYNREWCLVQQAMNTAIEKASEASNYPSDKTLNSAIAAYYYAFIDHSRSDKNKWKQWAYMMHNIPTDALEPSCDNTISECKTDTPLKVETMPDGKIHFTLCDAWFDDVKFMPMADPTKKANPVPSGAAWDVKCKIPLQNTECGAFEHFGDFFAKSLKFNALLHTLLTLRGFPGPQYNPSSKALSLPDALAYARGAFKSPQLCPHSPNQICPAAEARNNVANVLYYVAGVFWSDKCGPPRMSRLVIPPDMTDGVAKGGGPEGEGMVACARVEVITYRTWSSEDREACAKRCGVDCNHMDGAWYCACPQNGDGWKWGK